MKVVLSQYAVSLNCVSFNYHLPSKPFFNSSIDFTVEASLDINSRATSCILGPSGSGKTSILKLISGLATPRSGSVYINGELASTKGNLIKGPGDRGVCSVFQTPSLFPHKTVMGNVLFAMHGHDDAKNEATAKEFLAAVGMLWYAPRYPHELSTGQQQRVSLARAFASGSDIMLLDEPFSNLDVQSSYQIQEYLIALKNRYQRTMILVTHNAQEAMMLSDYIYVLDEGRIIQHGSARELYTFPCNLFVARFFGPLNTIKTYTDSEGNVILPFPSSLRSSFKSCNVFVGIRQESIMIGSDDEECVYAVITQIRFFGTYDLVSLMFCGGDILAMRCKAGELAFGEGCSVRVKFDWKSVLIFDANSNEVLL